MRLTRSALEADFTAYSKNFVKFLRELGCLISGDKHPIPPAQSNSFRNGYRDNELPA